MIQQRLAINLNDICKPELKSFAPETLDFAIDHGKAFKYDVSASL